MSAVVHVEKCFVAVVEELDDITVLRQSSLYVQNMGVDTILYGNSDLFFENLDKAKGDGSIILKRLLGEVAAVFQY